MFQLERLKVVDETLSQIVSEMYDERIETTEGMVGKARHISLMANEIMRIVSDQRYGEGITHEDS